MKFLVTSDTHLASSYPFSTSSFPFDDLFFRHSYYGLKQVIDYAIKNKIDKIIHLGDLFDNEKISSVELFVIKGLFEILRNNKIDFYINLGNHEREYFDKIPSILETVSKGNDYIHPAVSNKPVSNYNGIFMIPYLKEDEFEKALDEAISKSNGNAILCIHQNIKGIKFGEQNIEIKDAPISEKGLQEKLKSKFKLVLCGHIHFSYYNHVIPLLIPGSTCSIDFKDAWTVKNFYEIDIKENNIGVIAVPVENQIRFFNMDIGELVSFAGPTKNSLFKLRYKLNEQNEFDSLSKQMLEQGAIKVIPEIVREKEKKLSITDVKIKADVNEWIPKFMEQYSEDEINDVVKLNKELFNGNRDTYIYSQMYSI